MDLRKYKEVKESQYELPLYELVNGAGLVSTDKTITLTFVKCNKEGNQDGLVSETVISTLIGHLTKLNTGELRNKETSMAITNLQESLFWIEERKRDRDERGVSGTNKR